MASAEDPKLTKSQIDRLGERLKRGDASEADLRELDAFRRSFAPAHDEVVRIIQVELGMEPTSRRAKSTLSIVDKLRRESLRLSQMQDIAGCRVVVAGARAQEQVVQQLTSRLHHHTVFDRRHRPSHGYRAVHVVVVEMGRSVEIQVRTQLQHGWAEFSEKCADYCGHSLKYGLGPETIRLALSGISELVAGLEERELQLGGNSQPTALKYDPEVEEAISALRTEEDLESARIALRSELTRAIRQVTNEEG